MILCAGLPCTSVGLAKVWPHAGRRKGLGAILGDALEVTLHEAALAPLRYLYRSASHARHLTSTERLGSLSRGCAKRREEGVVPGRGARGAGTGARRRDAEGTPRSVTERANDAIARMPTSTRENPPRGARVANEGGVSVSTNCASARARAKTIPNFATRAYVPDTRGPPATRSRRQHTDARVDPRSSTDRVILLAFRGRTRARAWPIVRPSAANPARAFAMISVLARMSTLVALLLLGWWASTRGSTSRRPTSTSACPRPSRARTRWPSPTSARPSTAPPSRASPPRPVVPGAPSRGPTRHHPTARARPGKRHAPRRIHRLTPHVPSPVAVAHSCTLPRITTRATPSPCVPNPRSASRPFTTPLSFDSLVSRVVDVPS